MGINPIGKKDELTPTNFVEKASQENYNNSVFGENYWQTQIEENVWNTNFTNKNKNINPETSDFDWLEKDTKGKYNSEQFNLENLKQHYPESFYNITESTENKSTIYTITNKSNGKIEYVFDIYKGELWTSIDCTKFDSNDKELERICINDKTLTFKKQTLANGNIKSITFENNLIAKECILTPNNKEIETVLYSKGMPYKKIKNEKTEENFISKDLQASFNDKNMLGVLTNPEKLYDIIDRITPNNVYEVLTDYRNTTGNDLLEVLAKVSGKMSILKKGFRTSHFLSNTTEKIENCMRKCSHRDGYNTNEEDYIANLLIDNIYGIGSGSLKKTLDYITRYNIEEVLAKYRELATKKNKELSKNPLMPKSIANKFAAEEGLFKAILNETNLSDKERQYIILNLINKIGIILNKDTLKEFQDIDFSFVFDNSGKYCDDIKASMKLNENNPERILIDLQRLINRGSCKDIEVSKPNGKFDLDFKQGNTGDCWLLAGIISIINKDSGKNSLESLIEIDNSNKTVTINLKGIEKSYIISFDEIEAADHLSGGDGDIRAFELAIDKYMQEIAYSEDTSSFDINGNSVDYIYKLFFGETEKISSYSKDIAKRFNNQNEYYSLGSSIFEIEDFDVTKGALLDENNNPVDFVLAHAYAIVKSDENYVYLINPWESSQTLRITHEKLAELNPGIGCNKAI